MVIASTQPAQVPYHGHILLKEFVLLILQVVVMLNVQLTKQIHPKGSQIPALGIMCAKVELKTIPLVTVVTHGMMQIMNHAALIHPLAVMQSALIKQMVRRMLMGVSGILFVMMV